MEKNKYENSKLIMISYGMNQFFGQWITGPFGLYVFFFYETEIGLDVGLAALAFVLFSVWNAINDPLIGFIMERVKTPWSDKWGRRFPWIVIGAIPWLFSYILIFMVPLKLDPVADKWVIFVWLLVSTCMLDTFYTIWTVAATSMFPEKFRRLDERRTAAGYGTIIGMTGLVLASVVSPLLITFGVPETFRFAAWITIGVGFLLFAAMLPGVKEDKKTRELYEKRVFQESKGEAPSFITTLKMVLSDKPFVAKIVFFFGYQANMVLLTTSAPYMINFVLDAKSNAISLLMGGMLVGALLSVPVWTMISNKTNNNKKMSIIAGFCMAASFIPMIFVNAVNPFIVIMFFFGISLGGLWFLDPPVMGDVIDNVAIKTGLRQEAVYYGYQAFFIRLGHSFQACVFAVVHRLTGFVEGCSNRAELAAKSQDIELVLFGIRIHTAVVPAVLLLVCTFVFWKFYDLTPAKVAENQKKLKEMEGSTM